MAAPRWWVPDGRRKANWSVLLATGVIWIAAILFGFLVTVLRSLGWSPVMRQTRFRRCDVWRNRLLIGQRRDDA